MICWRVHFLTGKCCGQYFSNVDDGVCHGRCTTQAMVVKLRDLFSISNDAASPPTSNAGVVEQSVHQSGPEMAVARGNPIVLPVTRANGTGAHEATGENDLAGLRRSAGREEVRDVVPSILQVNTNLLARAPDADTAAMTPSTSVTPPSSPEIERNGS